MTVGVDKAQAARALLEHATQAVVRALAEQPRLRVKFAADRSAGDPEALRLSHLPECLNEFEVARFRGAADAAALRLRYSDAAYHAARRPQGAIAAELHEALEQVRVEALGARRFQGCRDNLAAERAARALAHGRLTGIDIAELPLAVALLLHERLNGRLSHELEDVLAPWRRRLTALIASHVHRLAESADHQQAYAGIVSEIIGILGVDGGVPLGTEPRAQDAPAPDSQPAAKRAPVKRAGTPAYDSASPEAGGGTDEAAASSAGARRGAFEAGEERGYRAYCTRFDEVVSAESLCSAQELARLRAQLDVYFARHQGALARLANRLRRRLLARPRRWWQFDMDEGLLDAGRLARVVIDPMSPLSFKQEKSNDECDTVVTLLIDNSGSMRGRPIAIAALSAELIARALERCGVKVEILGYTTRSWKGGSSRAAWVLAGRPAQPGRLNDLRHIIYKSADMSWPKARRNLGLMLDDGVLKENVDGEALLWAHGRLMARPEERRILMVISDGAPADEATTSANATDYLDRHLRNVINWIEARGAIELLAIGIKYDVTRYYGRAVVIADAAELGGAMVQHLIELFDPAGGTRRNLLGRRQTAQQGVQA